MAVINSFVDQYCDLGGLDIDFPDRSVAYSHIGAQMTLIKIEGVTSILSPEEIEENLVEMFGASGVASLFRSPGHCMSISFERHFNTAEEIGSTIAELHERARIKELSVEPITDEYERLLRRSILSENILLACWTLPNAAFQDEVKQEIKNKNKSEAGLFQQAKSAMSPYLRLDALASPHEAFVSHILDALSAAKIKAHLIGPDREGNRPDLAEIKRGVFFHETPRDWRPVSTGERRYPGNVKTNDFSQAFAPPLSRQILSSSAQSSKNFREISIGSRTYAMMYLNMFPREVRPFGEFLASLNSRDAATMPFRVTFHWEASDFKVVLKRILAGLFRWGSAINANFFDNIRVMEEMQNRDELTFVDGRVVACTWVEPHENKETVLNQRRSLLTRALSRWGDPVVGDITSNPMRALCESVSGMTMRSVLKQATKVPAPAYAAMMPFHRSAKVFDRGETLFISMDNTLVPHEVFSPLQNFWLTLILATPGSGKSVIMNRMNFDMAAYAGGAALPYLGIIDVGVSSSGFIRVIQEALPDHRSHEAAYTLLRNTRESSINPLDLGLGRRLPLPRERDFVAQFLRELLRLEETSPLVSFLIQRVYLRCSDMSTAGIPKTFQAKVDPQVDAGLQRLHDMGKDIRISPKTAWYTIADIFAEHGDYRLSIRAQRQASPRLDDLAAILAEPQAQADFGEQAIRDVRNALMEAIERYPIFSNSTTIDIDVARIISIDLQDVIQRDQTASARRNNTLMYMLARQLFVSKIAGNTKELHSISECMPQPVVPIYENYWRKTYIEMQEVFKRLCMDEYHLTNGSPNITAMVKADAREGRKWGLEIILASQLLKDFETLSDMASTVFILNSENGQAREEMRKVFDFSPAVRDEMVRKLHGPRGSKGVNFLARYKLSDQEHWIILNNRMGPTVLWALTTKKEDRLIRDALYECMSPSQVLRFLAHYFPQATAVTLWRQFESSSGGSESGLVERITEYLLNQYRQFQQEQEKAQLGYVA